MKLDHDGLPIIKLERIKNRPDSIERGVQKSRFHTKRKPKPVTLSKEPWKKPDAT